MLFNVLISISGGELNRIEFSGNLLSVKKHENSHFLNLFDYKAEQKDVIHNGSSREV